MKKALLFCVALAMIGAGAFAQQISFGSSGVAIWDVIDSDTFPGASGNTHNGTGIHQQWGDEGTGLTLSARGISDNATFVIDMDVDGTDGISVGDNAYIEIRPFEATNIPFDATILIGKSDKNEGRDGAVFGIYNWDRFGPVANGTGLYENSNEMIFDDLLDVNTGVAISLYPIQGLTIGVSADGLDGVDNYSSADGAWAAANVYAAYEIANVGTIRLGWDGRVTQTEDIWGIIGAAFDFDMVDNLHIGIGAKIPVLNENVASSEYSYDAEAFYRFALYANYNFNGLVGIPLTVHALFNGWYNNDSTVTDNFGFQAGLGVDYEVVDNVPIFLDVRYANAAYMRSGDGSITFGAGISRNWANCSLGVAFIGDTGGYASKNHDAVDGMAWTIPVKFSYNF